MQHNDRGRGLLLTGSRKNICISRQDFGVVGCYSLSTNYVNLIFRWSSTYIRRQQMMTLQYLFLWNNAACDCKNSPQNLPRYGAQNMHEVISQCVVLV